MSLGTFPRPRPHPQCTLICCDSASRHTAQEFSQNLINCDMNIFLIHPFNKHILHLSHITPQYVTPCHSTTLSVFHPAKRHSTSRRITIHHDTPRLVRTPRYITVQHKKSYHSMTRRTMLFHSVTRHVTTWHLKTALHCNKTATRRPQTNTPHHDTSHHNTQHDIPHYDIPQHDTSHDTLKQDTP